MLTGSVTSLSRAGFPDQVYCSAVPEPVTSAGWYSRSAPSGANTERDPSGSFTVICPPLPVPAAATLMVPCSPAGGVQPVPSPLLVRV